MLQLHEHGADGWGKRDVLVWLLATPALAWAMSPTKAAPAGNGRDA